MCIEGHFHWIWNYKLKILFFMHVKDDIPLSYIFFSFLQFDYDVPKYFFPLLLFKFCLGFANLRYEGSLISFGILRGNSSSVPFSLSLFLGLHIHI